MFFNMFFLSIEASHLSRKVGKAISCNLAIFSSKSHDGLRKNGETSVLKKTSEIGRRHVWPTERRNSSDVHRNS